MQLDAYASLDKAQAELNEAQEKLNTSNLARARQLTLAMQSGIQESQANVNTSQAMLTQEGSTLIQSINDTRQELSSLFCELNQDDQISANALYPIIDDLAQRMAASSHIFLAPVMKLENPP